MRTMASRLTRSLSPFWESWYLSNSKYMEASAKWMSECQGKCAFSLRLKGDVGYYPSRASDPVSLFWAGANERGRASQGSPAVAGDAMLLLLRGRQLAVLDQVAEGLAIDGALFTLGLGQRGLGFGVVSLLLAQGLA